MMPREKHKQNPDTHIDHMFEILPDAPNEDYENLKQQLTV